MTEAPLGFPADWLADRATPASDVELALLLVNSFDLLEEPPDRLVDLAWLTRAFTRVGHGDVAAELLGLGPAGAAQLRDSLRKVFESDDPAEVAALLNPLLEGARAVPLLVVEPDGLAQRVGVGLRGLAALEARLPAALAAYVADHGTSRLGVCLSDPCRCVFIDRTRAARASTAAPTATTGTPRGPTAAASGGSVRGRAAPDGPADGLLRRAATGPRAGRRGPHVWIQRTGATPYVQRHLPTGGVELHLPVGSDPQLVGPLTGAIVEVIKPRTTIVGVRFMPGAAPPLSEALDSLVDLRVDLKELWGSLADRLLEDVATAADPETALGRVQARLVALYGRAGQGDPLVREAASRLMPWEPMRISTLADHLAISAPQLRRRCLHTLGMSPKTLQRTLRFQGFLALAQANGGTNGGGHADGLAGLALDVGYADQAHLSRECLRLTGLTRASCWASTRTAARAATTTVRRTAPTSPPASGRQCDGEDARNVQAPDAPASLASSSCPSHERPDDEQGAQRPRRVGRRLHHRTRPRPGNGLGDGEVLFDWYGGGDVPSQVFDGFRLSEASARVFDSAGRAGRGDRGRPQHLRRLRAFGGGSPHPTAPLVVLSHRPGAEVSEQQTLVTTGIEDAIAADARPPEARTSA